MECFRLAAAAIQQLRDDRETIWNWMTGRRFAKQEGSPLERRCSDTPFVLSPGPVADARREHLGEAEWASRVSKQR